MNVLRLVNSDEYMYDRDMIVGDTRVYLSPSENIIYACVESTKSLKEQISEFSVKEFLENIRKNSEEDISNFFGTLDLDDSSFKNINQILDLVDIIELRLDKIDELEYINNNPILKNKKIKIDEFISIKELEKVEKLINKYGDLKDNIYVDMEFNYGPVSLSNCYETIVKIKEVADRIKQYDLSPLETIMYIYDDTRKRKYKLENKNESITTSRDLTNVLLGGMDSPIVRNGYYNLFAATLKYLDIDVKPDFLIRNKMLTNGHVRAIIYVKDDKYGIDGLYFFDPTYDSKYSKQYLDEVSKAYNVKINSEYYEYEFYNRYDYFARTKSEIDRLCSYNYKFKNAPITSKGFIKGLTKTKFSDKNIELHNWLNKLCDYVGVEIDFNSLFGGIDSKTKEDLDSLFSKVNKRIPAEVMLTLLNNVRKIEYQEDNNIPYSVEDLRKTYLYSNWSFEDSEYKYSQEDYFLGALYGTTNTLLDEQLYQFDKFISKKDIEKDIEKSKEKVLELK